MKDGLKKLKKKYKDQDIQDLVADIKAINKDLIDQGKDLVERLWYLETTKRFREYEGYERQEFKVFLWEICHIPYHRYSELKYAYHWFPEYADKFGPHVVQQVKGRVRMKDLPKTLEKIDKAVDRQKVKGKEREVINRIIDDVAPKKEEGEMGKDTKAYWKGQAEYWKRRSLQYEAEAKEWQKRALKAEEQLERQKASVQAFLKVKEAVEPMVHT